MSSYAQDLASRTIFLDPKRFYLDVNENQRGRFLKIAEVSPDGRKNQILMTFATANVFSENLVKMIDFYDGLHQLNPDNLKQGELKAEVMYQGDKKYHMDLKENARGRFLKVSETFNRGSGGSSRDQIFIPADAMGEIQQNLDELIKEYDNEDEAFEEEMKYLKIENKNFYFDIKNNQQGYYLLIAEVKGNHRNSIHIPQSGWDKFCQMKMFKIDQLTFQFEVNRNRNGRYWTICRRVNGNFRNSIHVPESGWTNFKDKIKTCVQQWSFPVEEVEEAKNETSKDAAEGAFIEGKDTLNKRQS